MNDMSDADEKLITTLLQGVEWLRAGGEVPAARVPDLMDAMQIAAARIGNRPKTLQCTRCGERNELP